MKPALAVGLAIGGALAFLGWAMCAAGTRAMEAEQKRCIHCGRRVYYALDDTRFGVFPAWRHSWNGRKHCHEAPSTVAEVA